MLLCHWWLSIKSNGHALCKAIVILLQKQLILHKRFLCTWLTSKTAIWKCTKIYEFSLVSECSNKMKQLKWNFLQYYFLTVLETVFFSLHNTDINLPKRIWVLGLLFSFLYTLSNLLYVEVWILLILSCTFLYS